MVQPVVVVSERKRQFAMKTGDRAACFGGATGGRLEVRQQLMESERRHRADRDPKEEQRAARLWRLTAEHGKSVSG